MALLSVYGSPSLVRPPSYQARFQILLNYPSYQTIFHGVNQWGDRRDIG